jgi:hypothetical protein
VTLTVNGGSSSTGNPAPDLNPFKLLWQIGLDDSPTSVPYVPYGEFSIENRVDDAAPGRVTRIPGDPLYSATTNPDRDDDYYCKGVYPVGFNGLMASLNVPNQEPYAAWERALSNVDKTNRVHFVLGVNDANPATQLRLTFELPTGGFRYGAPINRMGGGFGVHDVVIRFRNGKGVSTVIYSNRLDRATKVTVDIPAAKVAATAGANSIEFVRVGPNPQATSYWIVFDYLSLESAIPKSLTSLVGVQGVALSAPSATSTGVRAAAGSGVFRSGSGAIPQSVGDGAVLQSGEFGGLQYLTLTYSRPEPAPGGVAYRVEASGDLRNWSENGVVPVRDVLEGAFRRITVRDSIPLSITPQRFLRLRVDAEDPDSNVPALGGASE